MVQGPCQRSEVRWQGLSFHIIKRQVKGTIQALRRCDLMKPKISLVLRLHGNAISLDYLNMFRKLISRFFPKCIRRKPTWLFGRVVEAALVMHFPDRIAPKIHQNWNH